MTLLSTFVRAVQSLRARGAKYRARGGSLRSRSRRNGPRLEQLDHRQLLAVNFTGNVANDFTGLTPAVYLTDPNNITPVFPSTNPQVEQIVKVSGFALNNTGIAVNYDQQTDTLSVGFVQPPNQKPGLDGFPGQFPVIAGDTDNNGNNSTTDPAAAAQSVFDQPVISGSEAFYAVIDLSGGQGGAATTLAQSIFAGIPNIATPGYTNSTFVVAPAQFNVPNPLAIASVNPVPGAQLTQNEGNVYVPSNDPRHGALEFSITHFSQLYQQVTGHAFTGSSVISIGASAGSGNDPIGEEIFHFVPAVASTFTTPTPVPPPPPPPVIITVPVEIFQPTILINPHQNRHVNTAHYTDVRVTVLSSSSFPATQIDPSTVTLDGAPAVAAFPRIQLRDGFYSETFVFKGTDINLPPGFTVATISGKMNTGQTFTSSELIFNRNDSFYTPAQIASRDRRLARYGVSVAQENGSTTTTGFNAGTFGTTATAASVSASLATPTGYAAATGSGAGGNTVRLALRQQAAANAQARRASMYSTVAARSFSGGARSAAMISRGTTTPAATAPASDSSQSAAIIAHDLALQSLATGGAQSAA